MYHVYHGCSLNLGKRSEMIIFKSLFTTFEWVEFFEAARAVVDINLSIKSNRHIMLSMSISMIHTVAKYQHVDRKFDGKGFTTMSFLYIFTK